MNKTDMLLAADLFFAEEEARCETFKFKLVVVAPEDFPEDPSDPEHTSLGFSVPEWDDELGKYFADVCPAIMVETATAGGIGIDDWPNYLAAVFCHIMLHMELNEDPDDAIEPMVDAMMANDHPNLFMLFERVRAAQ